MALYGILGGIHGNIEALDAVLREFDSRNITQLLCVGDVIGYNADANACIARLRARRTRAVAGKYDLIGSGRLGFEQCSNRERYALEQTRRMLSTDSISWLCALPTTLLVDGRISLPLANVGPVDAQRADGPKLARCAILDSDAGTLEVLRVRYDAAATEAKAVVGGYRMMPVTDSLYTLRRRALALADQTASYFSRLMRSMLRPSMRISWVGPRRRGEWRSPSL